jgi:hypothetical protein
MVYVFLFNDLILLHQPSAAPPEPFAELQFLRTKVVYTNGSLIIIEKARYVVRFSESLGEFEAPFETKIDPLRIENVALRMGGKVRASNKQAAVVQGRNCSPAKPTLRGRGRRARNG